MAGYGPLDEDQVVVGERADDADVLKGHAVTASTATHLGPLEHARWVRRLANRARGALAVVLTVRGIADASEVVALQNGDEAVEKNARENLGLIKDGEVYYQFVEPHLKNIMSCVESRFLNS